MLWAIETGCLICLLLLTGGTLLNLSRSPHWFVRGWDFPRLQILALAVVFATVYFVAGRFDDQRNGSFDLPVLGLMAFLAVWHAVRIAPYTPLAPVQTRRCESLTPDRGLRVVVSNVEMENDQYERWVRVIDQAQPDILIVLEVDDVWMTATKDYRSGFAHEIAFPQDNWYGMLMLSQLPVTDFKTRYLVEPDVPSIDAAIRLRSGEEIRVVGVHPRPPEPIRDNDSAGRDAELICYGRVLSKEQRPVVIGGDLNDVAWSATTRLFLKLSGLLDPRRGRGFFNSFHAGHWWLRFPLDHLFHSPHFTLRTMRRLASVGSDHFPILVELQCEPHRRHEQESMDVSAEDEDLADEMVERKQTPDPSYIEPPAADAGEALA